MEGVALNGEKEVGLLEGGGLVGGRGACWREGGLLEGGGLIGGRVLVGGKSK